ncbi:hypothetical protein LSH36_379g01035 [Paralvinella palmiformis]|uniref:FERM central domain-containing protein n=1 Tax=Paralvinella palmiformis TaxID=53620 RepID=A0AAD9JDS4_9ANNE|nr:hypothetical protein LSH36_379g01035 [Paralvinella palmiformis]
MSRIIGKDCPLTIRASQLPLPYLSYNIDLMLKTDWTLTRDAILKGAHPISQERAVEFGGIQCQIQFGDHAETKHKTGFLDLKEFLPKEYIKVKGLEKKIYQHLASPEIGQAGGYGVPARGTDGFGTPCARDGAVSASPARLGGRSKIDLASSDRPTLL